jgi:hypothetical protein
MNTNTIRKIAALTVLAGTLAGGATMAQAQQVLARVISTSPVTESNGHISYNVTYEYAGHQYSTRTATPPGASISVNVGDYGVTTSQVAPQSQIAQNPAPQNPQNWDNVVPEQGLVVSGGGAPAPGPGYAQSAPLYAQPAPVYVQPAPVYYPAPAYYGPAYAYPPIGISLGFGYYRGWGGHWH